MALLDIRNLCIEIKTPTGRVKVVDNVNLTLNEGEICGLVGESGSGKSLLKSFVTLLKTIGLSVRNASALKT